MLSQALHKRIARNMTACSKFMLLYSAMCGLHNFQEPLTLISIRVQKLESPDFDLALFARISVCEFSIRLFDSNRKHCTAYHLCS